MNIAKKKVFQQKNKNIFDFPVTEACLKAMREHCLLYSPGACTIKLFTAVIVAVS
jgi:hypothetical protein